MHYSWHFQDNQVICQVFMNYLLKDHKVVCPTQFVRVENVLLFMDVLQSLSSKKWKKYLEIVPFGFLSIMEPHIVSCNIKHH